MTNQDNQNQIQNIEENKDSNKSNEIDLTNRNWLMLKEIEKGKSIKEAYFNAGYDGEDPNAPYQMYYKLKKRLELIYDADNVDSLRLKMRAKRILDMPVKDEPVKPEVHLKAIETLSKLQGHEKKESKSISPFIIIKSDSVEIKENSEPKDSKVLED